MKRKRALATAELRRAWRRYGERANVADGHTVSCASRGTCAECSCGFAAVESAIRSLIADDSQSLMWTAGPSCAILPSTLNP
jgi:hypothetical protein